LAFHADVADDLAFGFLGLSTRPTLIAIMFTLFQAWRTAFANQPVAEVTMPVAERNSRCGSTLSFEAAVIEQ